MLKIYRRHIMAKKVLIASYEIEIRNSIKKCLEGYGLEFIEAASGISLTYKSVELKPDLIIMSFSPANLAAYHKIKGGSPKKNIVPIILILPSMISLPSGTELKISDIVKKTLLLQLSRPSFREELIKSARTLLGDLKSSAGSTEKKEKEPTLPSWNDIMKNASLDKGKESSDKEKESSKDKSQKEVKKPPEKQEKTVVEKKPVTETKKDVRKASTAEPVKKDEPAARQQNEGTETGAIFKAKSLIDDLLEGKPNNKKEYHIEKSKELIDDLIGFSESPPKIVKTEGLPVKKGASGILEKKAEPEKPTVVTREVKDTGGNAKPLIKDLPGLKPVEIIRFEDDPKKGPTILDRTKKVKEPEKTKTGAKKKPGSNAKLLVENLLRGKPEEKSKPESKKQKTEKKEDGKKPERQVKPPLSGESKKSPEKKKEKLPEEKPLPEKDKEKTAPKRIILADDETDIRNGIKEALEMEGYSVITVNDGKELVNVGKDLKPDLIIADVIMPGLSGYRAVGQLKTIDRFVDIPVIFMTARVKDEAMYETLKPKGPSYFMPKTFEMEELLEKVNSILNKT